MRLTILYQDSDLIVVDKPAGIPTHAADPRDPYPGDALHIVERQAGLSYLGMHQRLDADTSGVLLFSARPDANKALAAAFAGRNVHKVYLAAVWGAPPKAEGAVDVAIVRDRDDRYRVTAAGDPRGQPARTRYRVLKHLRSDDFSRPQGTTAEAVTTRLEVTLLEIIPETGRTHQIRLHLAHIGCPVVGDPLYTPRARDGEPLYPFYPWLCLHAWRLTLPHPATGQPITFTAPAPIWVAQLFGAIDTAYGAGRTRADENLTPGPSPTRRGADGAPLPSQGEGRGLGAIFRTTTSSVQSRPSTTSRQPWRAFPPDAIRPLLELAKARRAPLAADSDMTIYRLVNAAGDGLPGLTVDRYGDALVAGIYGDEEELRPLPDAFWASLLAIVCARAVYVRYRPRQAGRLTEAALAALAPSAPVAGTDLGPAWFAHEAGLAYQMRSDEGLSVGLFPDMREGRARVRAWAAGRRVLNCFAYTCGFGVAATAGGATRVLNLDLSKSVLAWGQENYRANGFQPDPYDFVFGDVFDWLVRFARRGERFDMIILDPPGFARAKGRTFSAAQDYTELVALAARVINPGGLLLACCNVAELPWRPFRERVKAGVAAAGRRAEIIGIHHEPALDFPTFPGQEPYLKMVWLQL